MKDLKYLTLEDLEKFKVNLEKESGEIAAETMYGPLSDEEIAALKENRTYIEAVEAEIFERTVLGAKNDGGCST